MCLCARTSVLLCGFGLASDLGEIVIRDFPIQKGTVLSHQETRLGVGKTIKNLLASTRVIIDHCLLKYYQLNIETLAIFRHHHPCVWRNKKKVEWNSVGWFQFFLRALCWSWPTVTGFLACNQGIRFTVTENSRYSRILSEVGRTKTDENHKRLNLLMWKKKASYRRG